MKTQKTDWLGRDVTIKGTGPGARATQSAMAAAQEAWDTGGLAFVYKPSDLGTINPERLTDVLDGILRIGWQLHPAAVGTAQMALFVFIRPAPGR